MATWTAVSKVAGELPELVEGRSKSDLHEWRVQGKSVAWERPLRASDRAALGAAAPAGDVLAAYVPDLATKDAMVRGRPEVYFTTPHFDGYAMVLVRLAAIPIAELRDLLREAWRCRAPRRLLEAAPRANDEDAGDEGEGAGDEGEGAGDEGEDAGDEGEGAGDEDEDEEAGEGEDGVR